VQAEDKFERYHAILDAAEDLLGRAPDRLASMAEVADAAGLAKGTVYLYFPSKEELYLALHERNVDAFFSDVIARVEGDRPVAVADMQAFTTKHMLEPPLFLPLAARCFGLMAHSVSPEAQLGFKQRMMTRLQRAGAGLERHFPQLGAGGGVALLRRSYALIIGLWQLSAAGCPSTTQDPAVAAAHHAMHGAMHDAALAWSYPDDLAQALDALWRGSLEPRSES
jgi:AcrR family transcriptional regulator